MRKTTNLFNGVLLYSLLSLLTACGGGSNQTDTHVERKVVQDELSSLKLSGIVAGLSGTMSLNINNKSLSITDSGGFISEHKLITGEKVTLEIQQSPIGYQCQIESAKNFILNEENANNIEINCQSNKITLQASVSGLDSPINLFDGLENHQIIANGLIDIEVNLDSQQLLNINLSQAFAQDCQLDAPLNGKLVTTNDTPKIYIDCRSYGEINIEVSDFGSGEKIENFEIEVHAEIEEIIDNKIVKQHKEIQTKQNINESSTVLEGTGNASSYTLTTSSSGFVDMSIIIDNPNNLQTLISDIQLIEVDNISPINLNNNNIIEINDQAIIEIDGTSLDSEQLNPESDELLLDVTILDPSANPEVLPGNYQSKNNANEIINIESFGAINLKLRTKNQQNIAQDSISAQIHIPLAKAISGELAPNQLPLYYFSKSKGYWIKDGEAELLYENGHYIYTAEVKHLGTWTVASPYQNTSISGCVTGDAKKINIRVQGRNYISSSQVTASNENTFSLPVKVNSSILISAINENKNKTNTYVFDVGNEPFALDSCLFLSDLNTSVKLTWAENPVDLDAHLDIQYNDTSQDHIYYDEPEKTYATSNISLDVDDRDAFGPEIITLNSFPKPGVYRYFIHHFEGSSNIQASSARVELNFQGKLFVFTPPQTQVASRSWLVFEIIVTDLGRIELKAINSFVEFNED